MAHIPEDHNQEQSEQVDESGESSLSAERDEKTGIRRGIYLLPNLITTGALFSGFYAIIAAMSGSLEKAAIAVVIAGFLDALDGRIARMTHTQTEFGVQYDSLSDLVAFGVAPAVLMFSWVLSGLGNIGWMIAFLYMACAALRLARFNTRPDTEVFTGLASPAAAGTTATFVWLWADHFGPPVSLELSIVAAIFATVTALLMVSSVRYYSPKYLNLKGRIPFTYLVGIVIVLLVIFVNPPAVLFTVGLVYGASGPVQALVRKRRALRNP